MAKRPQPRKSSLAGESLLAPRAAAQAPRAAAPGGRQEAPENEPAQQQAAAAPAAASEAKSSTTATGKTYPHKVSFYQAKADTDRVRGALVATQAQEGYRSLSEFIDATVMAEVERLEAKYNNGQPFPAVNAKRGPRGRPMGT